MIAPAGFGKTSVMAEWGEALCARDHLFAWLSLDEEDDDVQQFISYLVATLSRTSEILGRRAEQFLLGDVPASRNTIVSVLVNEIAACQQQIFLVLDDFDRLTSAPVLAFVERLLRYAPDNFHVLLGVRSEPGLQLGKLGTPAKMLRVDAGDLRFSIDEAQIFFKQTVDVPLDRSAIAQLNDAAEGWVAGLQLASHALRKAFDPTRVASDLSNACLGVDTYFEDAVLGNLSPSIVDFLLRTSILDRFSAEVCDAVIGGGACSWEKIEWLQRHNVFIQPLDDERRWFRYHALLAAALRRRVSREFLDELPELHRRASRWFADSCLWTEAVKHTLAGGEIHQAAQWVERCASVMVDRCDVRRLLGWIGKMPEELVVERPRLRLAKVWGLALSMQTAEASEEIESIVQDISRQGVNDNLFADSLLQAELNVLRGIIAAFDDDTERAITFGGEATEAALQMPPAARCFAETAKLFGLIYEGRFDKVRQMRALTFRSESTQTPIYADAYRESMFGLAELVCGEFAEATRILEAAVSHAEIHLGPTSAAATLPAAYLALVYYERNDLERARKTISGRTSVALETCPLGALLRFTCAASRLYARDGNISAALALIEDARQVAARRKWLRLRVGCDGEAVRLYLHEGRLQQAIQTIESLRAVMPASRPVGMGTLLETWAIYSITCARVFVAEGRASEAVRQLTEVLPDLVVAKRWYLNVQVSTLLALAYDLQSEERQALASLQNALAIARRTGIVNAFVDEGIALRPLIERLRKLGPALESRNREFEDCLLLAFDTGVGPNGSPGRDSQRALSRLLSAREVEILGQVARGLSNKEIGRALQVAPETVKWHLKNIFEKLDVSSRTEAVRVGFGMDGAHLHGIRRY
ncbi:LuxR C-terminal-related transcriptional regulator [Burkholderia ubonensis]|uniref:LuxR C-terminal-related transcriptional regulator n=1 Tax=Burkholderia ubonensis TaxID=101571 RepID=UPI001E60DEA7